jgi:DNA-binding response OmpR family regulator
MAKRILIIDDDDLIRDLYEEVLKGEGFDVTVAKDGEEGLRHLKEGGFDVVLLDVMLPKLDGIGVLTKIKETPPQKQNGPILLLTNLDHGPSLNQALTLGAHSYLLKADMLPPVLIENIRKLTGTPSSATPPPVR